MANMFLYLFGAAAHAFRNGDNGQRREAENSHEDRELPIQM